MTFDKELDELVQKHVDAGANDVPVAAALVVKAAAIVAAYDNDVLEKTALQVFHDTLDGFKAEIRKARNGTA